MNYHFQGFKKEDLLKELHSIDQQIQQKNIKLAQKRQLEAEFYQDEKLTLADQIMKDLLKEQPKYQPISKPTYQPKYQQQFQPLQKQIIAQKQILQKSPFKAKRENHLINQRELQKNLLQDKGDTNYFPFGNDQPRRNSYERNLNIPEMDRPNQQLDTKNRGAKSPVVQKHMYNPFLKDEEIMKQKRQEQQKEYRKAIQKQVEEEKKRKEERIKQQKEMRGQFHDIGQKVIHSPPKNMEQKSVGTTNQVKKKADPNGKPPQIVNQLPSNDMYYMKMKVDEIKQKKKRGRMDDEEYEASLKKIEQYYGCKISRDQDFKEIQEEQTDSNHLKRMEEPEVEQLRFNQIEKEESNEINNKNVLTQRNEVTQSQIPQNYYYPQMGIQNMSMPMQMPYYGQEQANMEIMKRMFEELKEIKELYLKSAISEKQFFHETFTKLLIQPNNNMFTQQVPPIQHNSNHKEFFSEAKQIKDLLENKELKHKILPSESSHLPQSQSELYDRSLSAVMSKIPITKHQPKITPKQVNHEIKIDEFYSRKYKVKAMNKFVYISSSSQAIENEQMVQIPSMTNFIHPSNCKELLRKAHESDLMELRKNQTNKGVKQLRYRVSQAVTYDSQGDRLKINPVQSTYQYNSKQKANQLPKEVNFLKKHISHDETIERMAHNEAEMKMGSPINRYSPKMKSEILEQEEYQTEPRNREDFQSEVKRTPSYIRDYQKKMNVPTHNVLKIIKTNNELLSKYQDQPSPKQDSFHLKSDSSNYFESHEISPVKSGQPYEQSLQTIKSQEESMRKDERICRKKIKGQMGAESRSQLGNYKVETVESIEESSARQSRPPLKKKSTSRKKQSSIVRSKVDPKENPSSSASHHSDLKFDSHVYLSEHEESLHFNRFNSQNITGGIGNATLQPKSTDKSSLEPKIMINPPTIATPIAPSFSSQEELKSNKNIGASNKWKTLEEARKLAKERSKIGQNQRENRSSVEEKISELESFISKKDDSILNTHNKPKKVIQKAINQKNSKNILRLLDQLDDDSEYKQDFQSYREESQQYQ